MPPTPAGRGGDGLLQMLLGGPGDRPTAGPQPRSRGNEGAQTLVSYIPQTRNHAAKPRLPLRTSWRTRETLTFTRDTGVLPTLAGVGALAAPRAEGPVPGLLPAPQGPQCRSRDADPAS